MGFFDPPPPPDPTPEDEWVLPEWFGPGQTEVPGVVPIEVALAEADDGVVWLDRIDVYRHGFVISMQLLISKDRDVIDQESGMWRIHGGSQMPDVFLRVGIRFADGSKATNVGRNPYSEVAEGEVPKAPVMTPQGGGGGSRNWNSSYWVWPLPTEGPVSVVIEWPEFDVAMTSRELPLAEMLRASERSRRFFAG